MAVRPDRFGDVLAQIAIVDAGPLYAAADRSDRHHRHKAALLTSGRYRLIIPALVAAEACYLIGRRLGAHAEARFVEGLAALHLTAPTPNDLMRMAELVRRYEMFPLGAADASVIALAERLMTNIVITLDRRHFAAVKPSHTPFLELLPDPLSTS